MRRKATLLRDDVKTFEKKVESYEKLIKNAKEMQKQRQKDVRLINLYLIILLFSDRFSFESFYSFLHSSSSINHREIFLTFKYFS